MGKPLSIAIAIVDLLSNGPCLAEELPGPRYLLVDRIRSVNVRYKRMGSHWKIMGRWVHAPIGGQRTRTKMYSLVMEV